MHGMNNTMSISKSESERRTDDLYEILDILESNSEILQDQVYVRICEKIKDYSQHSRHCEEHSSQIIDLNDEVESLKRKLREVSHESYMNLFIIVAMVIIGYYILYTSC
jgi:hypothetical protein